MTPAELRALREAATFNGKHLVIEGLLISAAVFVVWLVASTVEVLL